MQFRTYPITQGLSHRAVQGRISVLKSNAFIYMRIAIIVFFFLVIISISLVLFITAQHQGHAFILQLKTARLLQKRIHPPPLWAFIVWYLQCWLHICQQSYVETPLHRFGRDHQNLRGAARFKLFRNFHIPMPFGDYCSISRRSRGLWPWPCLHHCGRPERSHPCQTGVPCTLSQRSQKNHHAPPHCSAVWFITRGGRYIHLWELHEGVRQSSLTSRHQPLHFAGPCHPGCRYIACKVEVRENSRDTRSRYMSTSKRK